MYLVGFEVAKYSKLSYAIADNIVTKATTTFEC